MTTRTLRRGQPYSGADSSSTQPQQRIDTDGATWGLDGKLISPGARAIGLRSVTRDMSGNIISGKDIRTGMAVQLPPPSSGFPGGVIAPRGQASAPASAPAPLPSPAPAATPGQAVAASLGVQPTVARPGIDRMPAQPAPVATEQSAAPVAPAPAPAATAPQPPSVVGLAGRFGPDWMTLNPTAHGFGSAEQMEAEAKHQGFPNALAMQRNRVLQGAGGKQPGQTGMAQNPTEQAATAARNLATSLPSGSTMLSGSQGKTILGPYGAGSNVAGGAGVHGAGFNHPSAVMTGDEQVVGKSNVPRSSVQNYDPPQLPLRKQLASEIQNESQKSAGATDQMDNRNGINNVA